MKPEYVEYADGGKGRAMYRVVVMIEQCEAFTDYWKPLPPGLDESRAVPIGPESDDLVRVVQTIAALKRVEEALPVGLV
jgi:hypothetical protein